jgi:hypothetical protein
MIEIAVAMICACLPSIRALFSRLMSTIFGKTLTYGTNSSTNPSRKTGTTQSTLTLKDYRGNITTVTTAMGPSNWLDDATNTSPSLSDAGEAPDTAQERAKRSDEIAFFHVSKPAIPLNILKRNHAATGPTASAKIVSLPARSG